MDPAMVNSGIASSGNYSIYTDNERPIDMHPVLYKNHPDRFPLQAILTNRMGEQETSQSTVRWSEHEEIPTEVYATGATAAGTAGSTKALTITNYQAICNHDILYLVGENGDYEVVKVQDSSIDSTVTVIAGWGGTTPMAVVPGTRILIMSPGYPESADEVNPRARGNSEYYNLTQEFDEQVKTSKRVANEATHFGPKGVKRDENISDMKDAWRRKFEMTLLLGKRHTAADSSGYYASTMDGIKARLENGPNYMNFNGPVTTSKLNDFMRIMYNNMPNVGTHILITGAKVWNAINEIARPFIRVSPNSKEYGINIDRYFGLIEFDLVKHPMLKGPGLDDMAFLLDFDYLKLKYQLRPHMTLDVGPKTANYYVDKMYGIITMMLAERKRHGMMTGITG